MFSTMQEVHRQLVSLRPAPVMWVVETQEEETEEETQEETEVEEEAQNWKVPVDYIRSRRTAVHHEGHTDRQSPV